MIPKLFNSLTSIFAQNTSFSQMNPSILSGGVTGLAPWLWTLLGKAGSNFQHNESQIPESAFFSCLKFQNDGSFIKKFSNTII